MSDIERTSPGLDFQGSRLIGPNDGSDRRRVTLGSPLLEGEGQGEVRDFSGEFAHLTPTLSYQEKELRTAPETEREVVDELGSAWTGYGEDAVRQPPARTLVAGIGFRAGTEPDEIVTLLLRALASLPPSAVIGAIATAADRADEAPIRLAAEAFGLVPIPVEAAALAAVDAQVPTRSTRIEASRGIGSLAEAAALAAAGEGGRLVLSRIASAGATCALAMTAPGTAR